MSKVPLINSKLKIIVKTAIYCCWVWLLNIIPTFIKWHCLAIFIASFINESGKWVPYFLVNRDLVHLRYLLIAYQPTLLVDMLIDCLLIYQQILSQYDFSMGQHMLPLNWHSCQTLCEQNPNIGNRDSLFTCPVSEGKELGDMGHFSKTTFNNMHVPVDSYTLYSWLTVDCNITFEVLTVCRPAYHLMVYQLE